MRQFFQFKYAWLWIIFSFFALNVLTCELYTSVWMDEVMFTDPAANQYFGRGFTSTAWAFQSRDAFWAGNVPLHSLLLCCWFKVFGFGIHQTRIFGYFLWSLATGAFCLAARRLGWVKTSGGLALLASLSFLGQGVAVAFRSARYEPLAVLLFSLCLLAFSIRKAWWRNLAILSLCSLFLPACLTLGPYSVMMGGLLWLATRGKCWKELAATGLGMAVGFGFLYLFYSHAGVWKDFLRASFGNTQTYYNPGVYHAVHAGWITVIERKVADIPKVLMADKSCLLLLAGIFAFILMRQRGSHLPDQRLLFFCALVFLLIPTGMLLVYAFPIYYWWMRFLPLCLAFVAITEAVALRAGLTAKCLVIVMVLTGVSLLGIPERLLLASTDLPERDYGKLESFIYNSVRSNDVVFADYQAFYPLKRIKVQTCFGWYLLRISPQEKASINCLVIDPGAFSDAQKTFGGNWISTGQEYLHKQHFGVRLLDRILPNYFKEQTNRKYNLAIYRRTVGPSADANQTLTGDFETALSKSTITNAWIQNSTDGGTCLNGGITSESLRR